VSEVGVLGRSLLAPDGGLIVSNGDAVNPDPNHLNEIVEFNREGQFIGRSQLDGGAAGAAAGIAMSVVNGEVRFAAADGNTNTLDLWTFVTQARRHRHGDDEGSGDDDGDRQLRDDPFPPTMPLLGPLNERSG
jgi:hypothetical protein